MSRTVADATRFTATSPHAYSKPSQILRSPHTFSASPSTSSSAASASSIPPHLRHPPIPNPKMPNPPPRPETPKQKVERIRAERMAQKLNQLTLWDRTVIRGRVWADRAHRITLYILMSFTVICFAVGGFATVDMLIYNRRQKRLFYAVQASLYQEALLGAIEAEKAGRELTEDERGAINRERSVLKAEQEAEDRKRRRWEMLGVGSVREGVKRFFVGGLGMGDEEEVEGEGAEGKMAAIGGTGAIGGGEGKTAIGKVEDVVSSSRVMQALQEQQRQQQKSQSEGESSVEKIPATTAAPVAAPGGEFDKLAENVAEVGKKATDGGGGGWSSWFGGK
ncbi:MAG: hypothetical protein LQ350_005930 [Teloschistes chrysophthalmus]|nr:MAG: hypothetical protein LQ350_005930 [Niorma chrysophthalma]